MPWFSRFFLLVALGGFAPVLRAADWVELQTPHFDVISEASESRTRAWAVEFELFRRGMNLIMPLQPDPLQRVTLVLFRSDRRLRPFKPQENGKASNVGGFFARTLGRNMIAISIEGARDDVRELIFHEGVHWHLSAVSRKLPLWMEEGLAEVFGNFRLSGNSFVIGATRPEFIRHVRIARPMKFSQLAAVGAGELNYNGKHSDHAELFYYQSWALVHALLFGTEGVGQLRFASFIARAATGFESTVGIAEDLGAPPTGMDALLESHLERGRFRLLSVPFDRTAVEAGHKLRPLSDAEADLALGNLLVGVNRAAEAEPYLRRAAAVLPEDARAAEALAIMCYALDRPEEMERQFRESFRRGGRNYFGYFLVAQMELQAVSRLVMGKQDPSKAAELLVKSIEINSRFVPAIESLAGLLTYLPIRSPKAEEAVAAAAKRFPESAHIAAGLALLESTYGTFESARSAISRAEEVTVRAKMKETRTLSAAREILKERERSERPKLP